MDWTRWPSWVGTPSQFGLLVVVLGTIIIAWIKVWPKLRQLTIEERASIEDRNQTRIQGLVRDVKECREECREQEVRLTEKIDMLQNKINNEALQRVQSEISLVHTLLEIVDAPQLRLILAALEKRKTLLPATAALFEDKGAVK